MFEKLSCWLTEHRIDPNYIKRRDDGDVECLCVRCGKLLIAPFGLAIKAQWTTHITCTSGKEAKP